MFFFSYLCILHSLSRTHYCNKENKNIELDWEQISLIGYLLKAASSSVNPQVCTKSLNEFNVMYKYQRNEKN